MVDKLNIFISHVGEDHAGITKFKNLVSKNGMEVKDYSVTKDKPNEAKSPEYIKYGILRPHIKPCSVFVVYVTSETKNSKWVDYEIRVAERLGKPIVGVWANGHANCDLPESLKKYANSIVAWDGKNVVAALKGEFKGREERDGNPSSSQKIARVTCQ